MSKSVGVEKVHKGKRCLNCEEPFEWPEFSSFFLKLTGNTLSCLRCQTENFFLPNKTLGYWVLFIISAICGLFIFTIMTYVLPLMMTYNENRGTFRIPFFMVALGIVMGLGFFRLCMKLLLWKTGTLSLDKDNKSVWDV